MTSGTEITGGGGNGTEVEKGSDGVMGAGDNTGAAELRGGSTGAVAGMAAGVAEAGVAEDTDGAAAVGGVSANACC